jgi:Xaa-Pro aminopeptidase
MDLAQSSWIKDVRTFVAPQGTSVDEAVRPILERTINDKGMQNLVLGLEMTLDDMATPFQTMGAPGAAIYHWLRLAFPNADFHNASPMLNIAQAQKSQPEIEAIKIACQVADFGMQAARTVIAVGMFESEVAGVIRSVVLSQGTGLHGRNHVEAYARCLSGPRSANGYLQQATSTSREIDNGDIVLVDLTVYIDGFWSKMTRTFFLGGPGQQAREMYDACLESQKLAIESIGENVRASHVTLAVGRYLTAHNLGEANRTLLGHGIGFSPSPTMRPNFFPGSDDILLPDVVHTLEPGIFIPGLGGIQIGDVVLDLGQGVEYLTKVDRSLDSAVL